MEHCVDLVSEWRKCGLESPPFLFPDDEKMITPELGRLFQSFDEYITSNEFGVSPDTKIHPGLLPVPYMGDLKNSSIFILMLNPGFSPRDYFAEQQAGFKEAMVRNLLQENQGSEFPFIYLNPQFAWHPGFDYWLEKLDDVIRKLALVQNTPYQQAMSILAKKLVCLQLFPYHSKSFGSGNLITKLPSVRLMYRYVNKVVVPKVKEGNAILIAARGVKRWRLPEHENIIKYDPSAARSASLSLKSKGGEAILKNLMGRE